MHYENVGFCGVGEVNVEWRSSVTGLFFGEMGCLNMVGGR